MNKTDSSDMNLYSVLAAGFPADRDACAIETPEGRLYSWADIERGSARIANLLAGLGLSAGARIAVQVEKSPEALLLYLGALRAGHVFLPLNTAYQAAEIDYFVENAEPSVVVCSPENRDWVDPIVARHRVSHLFTLGQQGDGTLSEVAASQSDAFETVPRSADDLACIVYTSGTTGRSKGAMLSHSNVVSNARTLHLYWRWRQGDVLLHALPIFHVHGLFVACHGALLNGSRMLWLSKFDPEVVLRLLPRATVFMGVPTMYVRLLDHPGFGREAVRGMRMFVSGSAPLLPDTFRQFEERTGQRILERYGMSETVMITSNPYDGNRVAGTVGLPLPGIEVRVVDEAGTPCGLDQIGAIQVRGPNVFGGYWRMPEKTKEEFSDGGFFRTGDMGKWDANGYLSIVGRSKDLIITGGYNVYPKEIESYLDEMDGVFESAVIGVPHHDFGEAVTAVVVPLPGASLDEAALIAQLRSQIAAFKVPKRIHVVDELPRNTMGKVQKNLLREKYAG
ncbi:MAG TPA: malonyl-CoA synthase [Burkholderiaceae bacterium]|mgnify:CR=1 FL=1|nr:malonyl-CoA synthase [Burkholderiaceae bacterium]